MANLDAYSPATLLQLCSLEAALAESRMSTRNARQAADESLRRIRRVQRLRQQVSDTAGRIAMLHRKLGLQAERVEAAASAIDAMTERQAATRERLRELEQTLQTVPSRTNRAVVKLRQDRIILEDLRAMLAQQRSVVAQQLLFIFPMDIVGTKEKDVYGGWSICGLSVIGPDHISRLQDSEETAAALGMVARVVDCVSRLMYLPLRFPVVPRGSRSTVCSPMSPLASNEWPLYMLRATDRPRLHMALRLLSVCVEQLLCIYGVADVDRHQLLPNLVQLLMAIEGCSFAQ
ncbi:hypothetical protein GGI20_004290 [Coemansia sp. BCRC 34301]|nr:hypothetical protein GGI20_004290 [Coemansia sp. BCRC 34301]